MRNGVTSTIDICCHGPCARCAESAGGAPAIVVSRQILLLLLLHKTNCQCLFSRKWEVVWPRAVILGSTTVMWIDGAASDESNVTVRLADSKRTFDEKTLALENGKAISPIELAIPFSYDGQLTVRLLGCDGCQSEEFPVHPLEAIQSLSLRLERTVYHPDDVGKSLPFYFLSLPLDDESYFLTKVSIWLACLDQHGQIMTGGDEDPERGGQSARSVDVVQVAAHDPNNVIVQYWSVSLVGSGLKNLLFQLSDLPQQTGTWTIRATAGGLTATQSFHLVEAGNQQRSAIKNSTSSSSQVQDVASPMIESHFVELDFSPRTATLIQQGFPFAGEVHKPFIYKKKTFLSTTQTKQLIAGTSERGITVGLDVLDQHGTCVHHQTVHFNRTTSTVIFSVPALHNLTSNATIQVNEFEIGARPRPLN